MLSEDLSESIRSEFFTVLNTIDPNTTLRELLRQEIAEFAGLMQKHDPGCVDDEGNMYRDEVARHQAEMEAEKRKQAHELLQDAGIENNDSESKLRSLAALLVSASGDWLNLDEE